jgi:hypothetical protein
MVPGGCDILEARAFVSIIFGDASCWTTATLGGDMTVAGPLRFTAATITEGAEATEEWEAVQ